MWMDWKVLWLQFEREMTKCLNFKATILAEDQTVMRTRCQADIGFRDSAKYDDLRMFQGWRFPFQCVFLDPGAYGNLLQHWM